MLYRILVLIFSSDVGGKMVSSWCRNSCPVTPACRMDTRETPVAKDEKTAAPKREPTDICALATQRTFFTQEEMLLAQPACAAFCYPK